MSKKQSLFKLLYGLYHTKIPTMVWGDPGEGKTKTIEFMASVLNVHCITKSGNKSDPTDFSGIPYTVDKESKDGTVSKVVKYAKPKYARELAKHDNGILFFDELPTCTLNIQAALLSIIQDAEFGEFSIPKSVFRIAAGNYSDIAGQNTLNIALMNRFVHVFFEADIEDWVEGFKSGWQNYELPKINPQSEWKDKENSYRLLIGDFITENPAYRNHKPKDLVDPEDVAFPSSRTWEYTAQVLSILDENDEDYVKTLVFGIIGKEVGTLFLKYVNSKQDRKIINIRKWLGKETTFRLPNPNRHDEVSNIVSSLMFYFKDEPKEYFCMWRNVMNVLHNQKKKFGNYKGYDSLIEKYMTASMNILKNAKMLNQENIRLLNKEVDDFNNLHALSIDMQN